MQKDNVLTTSRQYNNRIIFKIALTIFGWLVKDEVIIYRIVGIAHMMILKYLMKILDYLQPDLNCKVDNLQSMLIFQPPLKDDIKGTRNKFYLFQLNKINTLDVESDGKKINP